VLVSNRLPVTVVQGSGGFTMEPSTGGLAAALWPTHERGTGVWVGWPGGLPRNPAVGRRLVAALRARRLEPVPLGSEVAGAFYDGFSNSVLWPLLHYAVHLASFDGGWWEAYRGVNRRFARAVLAVAQPGDTIWVHDYHLMLLPALLRQALPGARLGFFLHTPFPSAEIFRVLPWRRELIAGILGADLVGFHVYDYLRHFRTAAIRILGAEGDGDRIAVGSRAVQLGAFPVGVDAERFRLAAIQSPHTAGELLSLRRDLRDRRLILGVDRMDYTKGIPERLAGYERFLEQHPRFHGRVELIQVGVPSRIGADDYRALRRRVEAVVGRINGRFGSSEWTPVKYIFRPIAFPRLCALYRQAAVMLVTPLRDGMNLVAKEYVACKADGGDGVLILSEFAGAAAELSEALLVNPHDRQAVADALHQALVMGSGERRRRLEDMLVNVRRRDVRQWGERFLRELQASHRRQVLPPPRLEGGVRSELLTAWRLARGRTLLLDYDGTLQPIVQRPELARPDHALVDLLGWLAGIPGLHAAVVSGRDRSTLAQWLGALPISLVAEHGRWLRVADGVWEDLLAGRHPVWLGEVAEIMEETAQATPGSFVERKSASVAWHYRGVDAEQGALRTSQLIERLQELRVEPPISVLHGKKVVEARVAGVSKGSALVSLLAKAPPTEILLAAGDDETDEEMFGHLPPATWTVHIGSSPSRARYSLPDTAGLRGLLRELGAAVEGVPA